MYFIIDICVCVCPWKTSFVGGLDSIIPLFTHRRSTAECFEREARRRRRRRRRDHYIGDIGERKFFFVEFYTANALSRCNNR